MFARLHWNSLYKLEDFFALNLSYSIEVRLSSLLLVKLVFSSVPTFMFVSHPVHYRQMRPLSKSKHVAVAHVSSFFAVSTYV